MQADEPVGIELLVFHHACCHSHVFLYRYYSLLKIIHLLSECRSELVAANLPCECTQQRPQCCD